MKIVRTILWTVMALAVAFFVYVNWGEPQNVIIWPREGNKSILFDWPVGFIAFIFFLLGFIPMWLFHRGSKWRMNRRIKTLENAARAAAVSKPVTSPPVASPTPSPESTATDSLTPAPEPKNLP